MPAYAHRMDGITGSAIRELFKLLSKGDIISFGGGNPSSSSFPVEQVKEITDYLLNEKAEQMLQYGAVTTPAGLPLAARLVQLERDMEELIAQLRPEAIAVEELFFSNNITTGIAVAHARGIILCTAAKSGIPLFEYTPMQVKQAVVGYGLAEKRQVMDMVKRLLKLKAVPRPDDAADALAIAICHARSATSLLSRVGGNDVKQTI